MSLVTVLHRTSKNIIPTFRSWTLHANAVVTEPYKLTHNGTGGAQTSSVRLPAVNGQIYTLSGDLAGNANAFIEIWQNGVFRTQIVGNTTTVTFTSNYTEIELKAGAAGVGTFVITNPQLEFGGAATPFEPR